MSVVWDTIVQGLTQAPINLKFNIVEPEIFPWAIENGMPLVKNLKCVTEYVCGFNQATLTNQHQPTLPNQQHQPTKQPTNTNQATHQPKPNDLSTFLAFLAFQDGTVATWGHAASGGDSSWVKDTPQNKRSTYQEAIFQPQCFRCFCC